MEITPLIKEDFLAVQDDVTLSELIGKLKQLEKRTALIFKKNKYLGLIEKKRLLRAHIDSTEIKVGHYLHKTPIINEHSDLIESAYLLFQSDSNTIPVERNKVIVGVLQGLDLAKLALELPETSFWKVKNVKLVKAELNKNDPLAAALKMMFLKRLDQIPLFHDGKLYGVISYRDILRKYLNWTPKRDISMKFNKMVATTRSAEVDMPNLANLPVESFCTNANLMTINPDTKLSDAVGIMIKNNLTDLIVQNGENVAGLLTVKEILRNVGSLKIPQNFNIKFVGLKELRLEPYQKYNLQKICSNEAFKLQRKLKTDFSLVVHVKAYDKPGTRQKYAVNLRIEYPGQVMSSSQDDWDLETALRKTFNNAKNTVGKKYKE